MKNKVTIQQIADLTGKSKFAVSRALSGKPGVSDETRDLIVRTAGELGYYRQPDSKEAKAVAKEVASVKPEPSPQLVSGAILVLFPSIRVQARTSTSWSSVFEGIASRLGTGSYNVLTLTEPSGDSMFQLFNPVALKGIIALGPVSTSNLLEMRRLGIPVVMVGHADPAFPCDIITTDNFASMRELVVKLISKGCRSFQFVGDPGDGTSFHERRLAFRSVLEEYGLPYEQNPDLISRDSLEQVIPRVLRKDRLPDVFVCSNDDTAAIVLEACQELGIAVPGQVGVTGFDHSRLDVKPLLTTVHVNLEHLGVRAADKILWRMGHPDSHPEKTLIYADPIFCESV
ncbi:LacI family DNA-binding transcriptional regulator [Gorillibacterium timonense]|uniref:LacI family DNA-binding transcriptional regulator n=1 Tax=Gorillibacterium timonense TaxID=1689269 RepID=UPI00071D34E9|nr:LacI family DNA-binding transcriptional regulator [Gorillibacterium timonense]